MTPPARIAAAAGVLDAVLGGEAAERALLAWARGARYAGSGDRAAVRDLVFGALRRRRSLAWIGGAETGPGLMAGWLRSQGTDPVSLMTGEGHALPPPLGDGAPIEGAPRGVRLDVPDWLLPRLDAGLGESMEAACLALADRAPLFLRVNPRRGAVAEARASLDADGIVTLSREEVANALEVTEGAPRVARSAAYLGGLVEIQDLSSQRAVLRLPLRDGDRVLDLCAGGGGKTLAMGARADLTLYAHDADPARMRDLAPRAARAGSTVAVLYDPAARAPYDLVLVDAPCSGSGTWRRSPDAKWRLTAERLGHLVAVQAGLLKQAVSLVAPEDHLAFATCSMLPEEGVERVAAFLGGHPEWHEVDRLEALPGASGDGFFQSVLRRA